MKALLLASFLAMGISAQADPPVIWVPSLDPGPGMRQNDVGYYDENGNGEVDPDDSLAGFYRVTDRGQITRIDVDYETGERTTSYFEDSQSPPTNHPF